MGLAFFSHEFVIAVCLWLGIPLFPFVTTLIATCLSVIDQFGDHLFGCSHGPLCIQHHDALVSMYVTLCSTPRLASCPGVLREQMLPLISLILGTFTIPITL